MCIVTGILLVGALIFWAYLINKARNINDVKDSNSKLQAKVSNLEDQLTWIGTLTELDLPAEDKIYDIRVSLGLE